MDRYSESVKAAGGLEELRADYQSVRRYRDTAFGAGDAGRLRLNADARSCWWAGQHASGRKTAKDAFPWQGAADTRTHLVDGLVNEAKALMLVALHRSRWTVMPTEANDAGRAAHMSNYLEHHRRVRMGEFWRESELAADWLNEQGRAVLGTWWMQRWQNHVEFVELEVLQQQAQSARQELAVAARSGQLDPQMQFMLETIIELPVMLLDASREDDVAEMARAAAPEKFGHLGKQRMLKVVRDLRNEGYAEFPVPGLQENRAVIRALQVGVDVFIPTEQIDPENIRAWYHRELVTETMLKERVHSMGYDRRWVAHVCEKLRGQVNRDASTTELGRRNGIYYDAMEDHRLFEVVNAYRVMYDEDWVPEIRYQVFHEGQPAELPMAKNEMLNYQHGESPFTLMLREHRGRSVDSSRGMGEIAATWQDADKQELDLCRDAAGLKTLPPLEHPIDRKPSRWGPGVMIPVRRAGEYRFADMPKTDVASEKVREEIHYLSHRYFGYVLGEENVAEARAMRELGIGRFLHGFQKVGTQVMKLAQQFESDEVYYRVVGNAKGEAIRVGIEELQGEFDMSVEVSLSSLINTEYGKELIDAVRAALEIDAEGLVDRGEALRMLFEHVSPNAGERLLRPAQSRAREEAEDELESLAQLAAGIPVNVKQGQNYEVRLQVIESLLQMENSPFAQKLEQDPVYREQLETRVKQLRHQAEQFGVNRQFGQLGAVYGAEGGRAKAGR